MKALITGANGQLGLALRALLPDSVATDYQELDITDATAVAVFDWRGIEAIVNAAAYTNVDGAETTEGRVAAWRINALGVANLAREAARHAIPLVHVSTDYVFDGTQSPHHENEPLSPLSIYGASKAAGDVVTALTGKHYIVRTSWVIGEGKNFVRTMLGLAAKNISPTVVADQVGRPTFAANLAAGMVHLLKNRAEYGTYNLSGDGEPASWAEVARLVFQAAGRKDLRVTDTTTAAYYAGKTGIAPRPLQSTLDLAKIKAAGFTPSDWRKDLAEYVERELA